MIDRDFFIAIGINKEGFKEVIGFDVYDGETKDNWKAFLLNLKGRGLTDPDLFVSDCHEGLVKAIQSVYPKASWQRCQVHFRKNIMNKVPKKYQAAVSAALTEMFNCKDISTARKMRDEIISEYEEVCTDAMEVLDSGFEEAMTVMVLPKKYRVTLRTTNILERENEELRRREKVIRIFPNKASAIRLMGAVLLDHHEDWLGRSRVFSMKEYFEKRKELIEKMPKLKQAA